MKVWHIGLLAIEGIAALAVSVGSWGVETRCGTVAGALPDTLIITDRSAMRQAHAVRSGAEVRVNGKPARLEDLKSGQSVTLKLESCDGMSVVTMIDAASG
jgi:hypothetical protein